MSSNNCAIIVLVHNNQKYIAGIIDYYKNTGNDLLIADSSKQPFLLDGNCSNVVYFHDSNFTITQKISYALKNINTPFVVLLGVDDFVLESAIIQGTQFLNANLDYAAVIGNDVFVKTDLLGKSYVTHVYAQKNQSIVSENPLERLETFFKNYRTIYCAIQRTDLLRDIFIQAENKVAYIYLNEYLTCIHTVFVGKIKYVESIHTVRQYDENSDGFIQKNIDYILSNDHAAFGDFINIHCDFISSRYGISFNSIFQKISECLYAFSLNLQSNEGINKRHKTFSKVILTIPYFGKRIINTWRMSLLNKKKLLINSSYEGFATINQIKNLMYNEK